MCSPSTDRAQQVVKSTQVVCCIYSPSALWDHSNWSGWNLIKSANTSDQIKIQTESAVAWLLLMSFQTYSIWASSCKNKTECNEMHPYISVFQVNTEMSPVFVFFLPPSGKIFDMSKLRFGGDTFISWPKTVLLSWEQQWETVDLFPLVWSQRVMIISFLICSLSLLLTWFGLTSAVHFSHDLLIVLSLCADFTLHPHQKHSWLRPLCVQLVLCVVRKDLFGGKTEPVNEKK